VFWADKRNVEHVTEGIEQARKGEIKQLSKESEADFFGL
jgi:hypothetical protein